jgi:hypothetical protein
LSGLPGSHVAAASFHLSILFAAYILPLFSQISKLRSSHTWKPDDEAAAAAASLGLFTPSACFLFLLSQISKWRQDHTWKPEYEAAAAAALDLSSSTCILVADQRVAPRPHMEA